MKAFTSYFGNRNIPESVVNVSISVYPPKWFNGLELKILAPRRHMIREGYPEDLSKKKSTARYSHQMMQPM